MVKPRAVVFIPPQTYNLPSVLDDIPRCTIAGECASQTSWRRWRRMSEEQGKVLSGE
jgi:hypothetical protein